MGKIITIGGGEFTRGEIESIDRYALDLTGKTNPRILYIPTASNDSEEDLYNDYFHSFGCSLDILCLISRRNNDEEIREKIFTSDYIFAGGGDAILLMDVWKKYKVDEYIRKAYEMGIVLSGISAGSICYYEVGHTDSLSYHSENWDYHRMSGIGIVPAIHSPHYNSHRHASLMRWMINETIPAVGLEDNSALVCIDGKYNIITSNNKARAHILRNIGGNIKEEILTNRDKFEL